MLEKLKQLFGFGKGKKEVKQIPHTPKDVREIPKAKLKEMGRLKAENAKLKRQVTELTQRLKASEEGKPLEKRIKEQKQEIEEKEQEKKTFLPVRLDKEVKVLSKDHELLGYLDGFSLNNESGTMGIVVTLRPNGEEAYEVFSAGSLNALVHHSEKVKSQLDAGVLILNRMYNGDFVPDIDTKLPSVKASEVRKWGLKKGG